MGVFCIFKSVKKSVDQWGWVG